MFYGEGIVNKRPTEQSIGIFNTLHTQIHTQVNAYIYKEKHFKM